MAKIWRQQPFEVLLQWVEAIIVEASDDLNAWETNFINDIQIRIVNQWSLTQRQEEILEKIYTEKTS